MIKHCRQPVRFVVIALLCLFLALPNTVRAEGPEAAETIQFVQTYGIWALAFLRLLGPESIKGIRSYFKEWKEIRKEQERLAAGSTITETIHAPALRRLDESTSRLTINRRQMSEQLAALVQLSPTSEEAVEVFQKTKKLSEVDAWLLGEQGREFRNGDGREWFAQYKGLKSLGVDRAKEVRLFFSDHRDAIEREVDGELTELRSVYSNSEPYLFDGRLGETEKVFQIEDLRGQAVQNCQVHYGHLLNNLKGRRNAGRLLNFAWAHNGEIAIALGYTAVWGLGFFALDRYVVNRINAQKARTLASEKAQQSLIERANQSPGARIRNRYKELETFYDLSKTAVDAYQEPIRSTVQRHPQYKNLTQESQKAIDTMLTERDAFHRAAEAALTQVVQTRNPDQLVDHIVRVLNTEDPNTEIVSLNVILKEYFKSIFDIMLADLAVEDGSGILPNELHIRVRDASKKLLKKIELEEDKDKELPPSPDLDKSEVNGGEKVPDQDPSKEKSKNPEPNEEN